MLYGPYRTLCGEKMSACQCLSHLHLYGKEARPGRTWILTVPPRAKVSRPSWTAAVQTEQSIRLGYWMDWNDPAMLRDLADKLVRDPAQVITVQGPNGPVTDTVEQIVGRLGLPELGGSYFTFSNENNYMIWTFLKKCWESGWVYRGHDVMPWCPRCATGISDMEINEGRREVQHTSSMDSDRLAHLNSIACRHRVAAVGDDVAAFLIAMRDRCGYVNPNFEWFAARYPGVNVAAYFTGKLAKSGERIAIEDGLGRAVLAEPGVAADSRGSRRSRHSAAVCRPIPGSTRSLSPPPARHSPRRQHSLASGAVSMARPWASWVWPACWWPTFWGSFRRLKPLATPTMPGPLRGCSRVFFYWLVPSPRSSPGLARQRSNSCRVIEWASTSG